MYEWFKFFHLAAGVVWLGGMTFMVLILRPVVISRMPPPERLVLMAAVLSRFFVWVWIAIFLLLSSGFWLLSASDMQLAPRGWHVMSALGLIMCFVFAHIWFAPFKRLKKAVTLSDWPAAGHSLAQIHPLVLTNLCLGWIAIAAVLVFR